MTSETTTKQTLASQGKPFRSKTARVKLGQGGRIVLPAEFRHALGMEEGDTLFIHLREDGIEIQTPDANFNRIEAIARQYIPEGVSLVDQLLALRREEAEQEEEEIQKHLRYAAERKQRDQEQGQE